MATTQPTELAFPARSQGRRRASAATRSKNRFVLVCLAPALVMFVVFMVIPTINVFRMAFFRWGRFSPDQEFVGLANFRILLEDMAFVRSFQNTVLLLVIVTIATMALALMLAALMTRVRVRGRNLYRFVLYIPNVLSVVVIAAMFSATP